MQQIAMLTLTLLQVLFPDLIQLAHAFSSGAPDPMACARMTPEHPPAVSMTTDPPYVIEWSQGEVSAGEIVNGTFCVLT